MSFAFDVIMIVLVVALGVLLYIVIRRLSKLQNDVDLLFDVFDKEVPEILSEAKRQPYVGEDGLYSFDNKTGIDTKKLLEGDWIK